MIDRTEILAFANETGLQPHIVEKDYVLGWLLAGIFAQLSLKDAWVFKGGTCLKKCYFETYRFSEDLDFTLLDEAQLNGDFLQKTFSAISTWLYEQTGLEIPAARLRFDLYNNPRGHTSCQGRIYYRSLFQQTNNLPRIKLDLTADETLVMSAVRRPVAHPYSDEPDGGITALSYAYEEVFGEKIRALGERSRPRDLYDVVNLFRHQGFQTAASVILDVVRRKCAFKGIEIPNLDALNKVREQLVATWQSMLERFAMGCSG